MNTSIKLGRIWGIPIGLHFSWFLVFGLVTWSLALGYFPGENPSLSTPTYWILGAITSILFFSSVLVHELAHKLYPEESDDTIERIESAMSHHLSDKQWRNLWCAVADAMVP